MGLLSTVTEIIATICENVIILWFLTSFFGAKYTGIKKYSAFVATVVITTAFFQTYCLISFFCAHQDL